MKIIKSAFTSKPDLCSGTTPTIFLQPGVPHAEIVMNRFDGVCFTMPRIGITFVNILNFRDQRVIWRSNTGLYQLAQNIKYTTSLDTFGMAQCMQYASGQAAGCDYRAVCANESYPGNQNSSGNKQELGVTCSCNQTSGLEPAKGDLSGSHCIQKQNLSAFFKVFETDVTVQKPENTTVPVFIEALGENTTIVAAQSNASFIEIKHPNSSVLLSASESRKEHTFTATIVGTDTPWDDSVNFNVATVEVTQKGAGGTQKRTVSMNIQMKPHPSCKHSQMILSGPEFTHLASHAEVEIVPRDTDNLSITQTPFKFQLHLQYENEQTIRKAFTAFTTKTVPLAKMVHLSGGLSRPGHYTVATELVAGWSDSDNSVSNCVVQNSSFNVLCGSSHYQDGTICRLDESSWTAVAVLTSLALVLLVSLYLYRQRAVKVYALRRIRTYENLCMNPERLSRFSRGGSSSKRNGACMRTCTCARALMLTRALRHTHRGGSWDIAL